MKHYICIGGCRGVSVNDGSSCHAKNCPRYNKLLQECDCENGKHFNVFGVPLWKEVLRFLAGFQTAHVLGHIILGLSSLLPFKLNLGIFSIIFTPQLNAGAIIVNGIVLLALFYFGYRKN